MTARMTTVGDRIVIILASVLVVMLYGLYWRPSVAGAAIEYQTPQQRETVPLDQDRTLELDGPLGVSRIEIRDGAARFLASPCRNQYCVHSGWLRHGGDFAACLPNQITLLVQADKRQVYDAINY